MSNKKPTQSESIQLYTQGLRLTVLTVCAAILLPNFGICTVLLVKKQKLGGGVTFSVVLVHKWFV
jgi:hypothetical protein